MKKIFPSVLLCSSLLFTAGSQASLVSKDLSLAEKARETASKVNSETIGAASENTSDWLTHGRTYDEQRFSPLDQINEKSVKGLGLAWEWDTGRKRGLEATPLVVGGVIYTTGTYSEVIALDAKTGELIWRNDLNVDRARSKYACCDVVNRGLAAWEGKLFVGTIDGRLVALDAVSGEILWDTLTIDLERPYTITGAPRVVKGKVIIGNGGAEFGVRGYITAYDANNGEQVWRFYTVPGNPADGFENEAMAMAAKTWGGGPWWEIGGGGTAWDSMAFDPDLDLLYVGVGNGAPWNKHIRSPSGGDNLFISSIVAVRPDTGEYVWHYQTTPGDAWDYTATQHMILADLNIDNKLRQVIMQAPKNGFYYVIDRATGEFISADNYVPVSWASHIDPETGRPVETDNSYKEEGKLQFPSPLGGHNWQPMCFSKDTGYVYIPSRQLSFYYSQPESFKYKPGTWNVGIPVMKDTDFPVGLDPQLLKTLGPSTARGYLQAWDPIKQERVWEVQHTGPWNGGVLCTGGDLVFQGNASGYLVAYSASTGKEVWSYNAKHGIIAPPITYQIDGEQYITVMAGFGGSVGLSFSITIEDIPVNHSTGRVLTFKLGGNEKLAISEDVKRTPEPPALNATDEVLALGNRKYHENCVYCHGPGAISSPAMRDLRYMNKATHEQFMAIVMEGSMEGIGMPNYSDMINEEEAKAVHAYLIALAHKTLESEDASSAWLAVKGAAYSVMAYFVGTFDKISVWFSDEGK
ncbi:MAG: PQQ-dependent dehydrogenase, methanol/ethanol family [Pseudomonadales bacterium]|nr:PQQ-dependent dehydrogenase, methanol/ethanol family [Pseudomonadales bacterium]